MTQTRNYGCTLLGIVNEVCNDRMPSPLQEEFFFSNMYLEVCLEFLFNNVAFDHLPLSIARLGLPHTQWGGFTKTRVQNLVPLSMETSRILRFFIYLFFVKA